MKPYQDNSYDFKSTFKSPLPNRPGECITEN